MVGVIDEIEVCNDTSVISETYNVPQRVLQTIILIYDYTTVMRNI